MGVIARQQGDNAKAIVLLKQSLPLAREVGVKDRIATILLELGLILQQQGELHQAASHFYESLDCQRWEPTQKWVILLLVGLAAVAVNEQRWEYAGYLGGAAESLHATIDRAFTPWEQADYLRNMRVVRSCIYKVPMKIAWQKGQTMTLAQAISYTLATPIIPKSVLAGHQDTHAGLTPVTYPAGLTAREVEVLRLPAQGLTYAQIAEKLIITRRTVNGHVTSIYSKLGVNGRAVATRFALEQRLV